MCVKSVYRYTIIVLVLLSFRLCVSADVSEYHNYESMTAFLRNLAKAHPNLVKLESLGKTIGKRDVWSVTISSGNADEHPALLVVGGIEGADLIGSEMCLQFINILATEYTEGIAHE